jgi:hypothetical protein
LQLGEAQAKPTGKMLQGRPQAESGVETNRFPNWFGKYKNRMPQGFPTLNPAFGILIDP